MINDLALEHRLCLNDGILLWEINLNFYLFFFLLLVFFFFYFIFKLYITGLDLPNIKMNPPQVYMCSPS